MKLMFVVLTFFSSSSWAFNFDPGTYVKDQEWNELMQKVATEGSASDSGISELRALTQIIEIQKDKEHLAMYLTTSGRADMFGNYAIFEVSLTTEHWKLSEDGKEWIVDQWFYYMTAKGDFRYATHNLITKSLAGIVTVKHLQVTEADNVEAAWAEKLSKWLP